MSYVVVHGGPEGALLARGWRVPAAEVAQLRDGAALLAEAERTGAAVQARVEAAEAEARREGYAAGVEEGRRAAAVAAADSLSALTREVRAVAATTRDALGRLSLEVVRRIAAEVGPQTMLEAVAEKTVREVLSEQPLVVRVAPAAAPGVAQRLWPLNAELEVVGDAAVGEGECVVVSRHGSTHAGLAVQLAALDRAFREAGA